MITTKIKIREITDIDLNTEEGMLLITAIGRLQGYYPNMTAHEILMSLVTHVEGLYSNDRESVKE